MTLRITGDMDPDKALWIDTGIPERYRNLRVEQLFQDAQPTSIDALGRIAMWLRGLPEQQRTDEIGIPLHPRDFGCGLLLAGPPGSGKTTAAAAVACDVRRLRASVYFARWPQYVNAGRLLLADTPDPSEAYRAMRVIERARTCLVVILDDVGHEHTTASRYAEDLLEELLRERHEAGRPTVITTNLSGTEWANRYSTALRSFMARSTVTVPFLGPDLGQRHAQG